MIAEIIIDESKCTDPLSCRKCLEICPGSVFTVSQRKVEKFKETDPKDFQLMGRFFDCCTGCMDCVNQCPKGALQVVFISNEEKIKKLLEIKDDWLNL